MSGDNSLRELFPSSERIAIGGSDPSGTNAIERLNSLRQAILRDLLTGKVGNKK